MNRGYTFKEFVAALESENFNEIEPDSLEWAKWVESVNLNGKHDGDCIKVSSSCLLCTVTNYLQDYDTYIFFPEFFERKIKEEGTLIL